MEIYQATTLDGELINGFKATPVIEFLRSMCRDNSCVARFHQQLGIYFEFPILSGNGFDLTTSNFWFALRHKIPAFAMICRDDNSLCGQHAFAAFIVAEEITTEIVDILVDHAAKTMSLIEERA